MRVIVRKERPHPGAQLRLTDPDGMRVTAFATNTTRGQLADLELRRPLRGPHPRHERHRTDPTCHCTTSPRTRSGAPSSHSPSNSPPGCRCSPWPVTTHTDGNPSAYGYDCSASPHASPSTDEPDGCTSRRTRLGQAARDHDHHTASDARTGMNTTPTVSTNTHPGSGTGTHPSDSGRPSHPRSTITHNARQQHRDDQAKRPRERSGLGPLNDVASFEA